MLFRVESEEHLSSLQAFVVLRGRWYDPGPQQRTPAEARTSYAGAVRVVLSCSHVAAALLARTP
jgi:hypothetical protein